MFCFAFIVLFADKMYTAIYCWLEYQMQAL